MGLFSGGLLAIDMGMWRGWVGAEGVAVIIPAERRKEANRVVAAEDNVLSGGPHSGVNEPKWSFRITGKTHTHAISRGPVWPQRGEEIFTSLGQKTKAAKECSNAPSLAGDSGPINCQLSPTAGAEAPSSTSAVRPADVGAEGASRPATISQFLPGKQEHASAIESQGWAVIMIKGRSDLSSLHRYDDVKGKNHSGHAETPGSVLQSVSFQAPYAGWMILTHSQSASPF